MEHASRDRSIDPPRDPPRDHRKISTDLGYGRRVGSGMVHAYSAMSNTIYVALHCVYRLQPEPAQARRVKRFNRSPLVSLAQRCEIRSYALSSVYQ
jgi:hypothetical protein